MNKQELIERIEGLKNVFGNKTKYVEKNTVIELISELDEPQKVKVSEEEAKFLETFDFNCESDVTTALYHVSRVGWGYYLKNNDGIELKDLSEGFRDLENRKRLIRAILFGYEVEKEPKYTVRVKEIAKYKNYLVLGEHSRTWFFANVTSYDVIFKHTRKELEEAGFGWVLDCPGIEIEEVE